jgi:hypothetical protein
MKKKTVMSALVYISGSSESRDEGEGVATSGSLS